MNLDENGLLKLALQTYMSARKILPFVALLLLFCGIVLAGTEPMQAPWVRVALAGLLTVAYIATLHHCRDATPKKD